jgi:CRP/FNR family transcriptional regulator, polysaccharide utilization system transcription regulator
MQYNNPHIELCLEGSASILRILNQKDKESIANHTSVVRIDKGEYIFHEGDKTKGLICLTAGKVKIFKEGVGGRDQILKMVQQQGLIGHQALFTEGPWIISAAAIEDSVICIMEKNTLLNIIKKNGAISLKFLRLLTEELVYSNNRTVSLSQKHVRGRLAESLIVLRNTYGYESDGKTLSVSLSREDIAHLSNMTTSNAIRTLSSLAAERIIKIKGKKIGILDSPMLEHISELG